jgi:hypothetical protein
MTKPNLSIIAALLCVSLALTSCSNSLTTDLDLIVTTTSAVVDIATPQYAAILNPYFSQVTTFIDETTTELATSDTTAQKAAVLAADAAKIAVPNLNGLPAELVTRVGAIAPLIAQLVTEIQGLTSQIDSTPGGAQAFFAAHKVKQPSTKDLAKVRAKNAALRAKLKK